VLGAVVLVALALVTGEAPADAPASASQRQTFRASFAFKDAEYLTLGEAKGGHVVVPARVAPGERVPLVVLLHGVNIGIGVHMWLGAKGEPDLAPLVERVVDGGAPPFLFAAPSQTKGAWSGRSMWKDFELDDFVKAVDDALGARARVDRSAVIVMGHSGAACNPDGGLLHVARARGAIVPRAILAVDTCLDEETGDGLGHAPSGTEVWVRWQPDIWPRPIDRFRAAFSEAAVKTGRDDAVVQRVDGLGPTSHDAILLDTIATVIPSLLAPPHADGVPPGASDP
jgi:hypothetical protein